MMRALNFIRDSFPLWAIVLGVGLAVAFARA